MSPDTIWDCETCGTTTRTTHDTITPAPPWREVWEHDGKGDGANETFMFCSLECLIAWATKRKEKRSRKVR